MWTLLFAACTTAPPTLTPQGPPAPLADTEAWRRTAPLEGIERLFVGPFRCSLPGGDVADFHPNGMVRTAAGGRGRWSQAAGNFQLEGEGLALEGPYEGWSQAGAWMLATPLGALGCRPGHEGEVPAAGPWLRVRDGGGPMEEAGRALTDASLPLVVQQGTSDIGGIALRHRPGFDPTELGQHLADQLQQPVRLEVVPSLPSPYELVVGD